ncbi:MAG: hypothetical protein RL172_1039, partial [Bacteroidota bacterium]
MRFFVQMCCCILLAASLQAQSIDDKLRFASSEMQSLDSVRKQLAQKIEHLKLLQIQEKLDAAGLPAVANGEQLVRHAAYSLCYAEKFEQARWVAHMIVPDVVKGTVFRTNDFRPDPLVQTGSAVEEDYFLKRMKPDSSWEYDAFGYDRGHLAPSADFRWSSIALSESYFYSNMSPQLADFNRGAWGDLEDAIRAYLYTHPNTALYVVTGPVLKDGLPVIPRAKHKVAIPQQYFKAVVDLQNKNAIGFIMPNQLITQPLHTFAVSINDIEQLTGLNLFNKIPAALQNELEVMKDAVSWLPVASQADVAPVPQQSLRRNHFNTTVAKQWMGHADAVSVCGRVVGARLSRGGNVLLNL